MEANKLDIIEAIARTAHEANRAYCESLGDTSQLPWDQAPDWARKSAIEGVVFHIQNPDATPEDSHASWLEQKRRDGWRFGEVKDPLQKTHPCFRPYDELPLEQRTKDHLFVGIVKPLIDSFRNSAFLDGLLAKYENGEVLYGLKNRFSYHAPVGTQTRRYERIRATALAFAEDIVSMCPTSRELDCSLMKLDEVVFWANASIARNE